MRTQKRIRPALEVIIEFSAIFFYIWFLDKAAAPQWFKGVFFWGFCVGFPIFCIGSEQRYYPEFSLDWGAFLKCLRLILWFTLAGTGLLVFISLYFKSFNYDEQFLTRVSEYFFWAFLQQIGLQTFLTRRVEKAVRNPYLSAFLSSTLFALLHMPNPALVIFSWVGGFFWALSFQATPNLYALAVSHGWLAVVAWHCVPPAWLHGLRIGPTYWKF